MRTQAARYFAYSKSLLVAILLGALSLSCMMMGLLGSAAMVAVDRNFGWFAIGGIVGYSLLRLFGAAHGRGCHCQLCHGPVLVKKECNKHRDARRYPLMSYRQSLLIDAAVKGQFNCMYCGTPYRMRR